MQCFNHRCPGRRIAGPEAGVYRSKVLFAGVVERAGFHSVVDTEQRQCADVILGRRLPVSNWNYSAGVVVFLRFGRSY